MTFAIFHDFPDLENGLPNSMTFHDQGHPVIEIRTGWRHERCELPTSQQTTVNVL